MSGDTRQTTWWERFRAARRAPFGQRAQQWHDFGQALAAAGRRRAALYAMMRAMRRDPIATRSRHAAAELHEEFGELRKARETHEGILAINPHDAWACARAGRLLRDESMAHAVPAEGYLRRAHHLGAPVNEALLPLCHLLTNQNRDREIVDLTAGYDRPDVLHARNNALVALGAFDQAAATIEQIFAADSVHPMGFYDAAALRRPDAVPSTTIGDHAGPADAAETLAAESAGEKCAAYAFAAAYLYEHEGEYERAWANYVTANEQVRARLGTNIDDIEDGERRIIEAYTPEVMAHLQRVGITTSTIPVFIVGMPRSGTTLVERILGAHPEAAPLGERPDLQEAMTHAPAYGGQGVDWPERAAHTSPITTAAIGGSYNQRMLSLAPQGTRATVDKHVAATRQLGMIAAALPRARIIHITRDPRDVAASCYAARFQDGLAWSFSLADIARRQASHDRLMAHWREVLPPGRMLEVAYEDLVEAPETVTAQLLDHIGLSWDPVCVHGHSDTHAPVHTSSARQVRSPISASSVGRWQRFPEIGAYVPVGRDPYLADVC